jgi:hypothetical protein
MPSEVRDRKNPISPHQISLQSSFIEQKIQPIRCLEPIVLGLRQGQGIVDAYAPTPEHGTPPGLLRCELAAVGYREISLDGLTGSDAYLAIFAPPSVASRTRPEAMLACKAP